jgi:hypothetical protein
MNDWIRIIERKDEEIELLQDLLREARSHLQGWKNEGDLEERIANALGEPPARASDGASDVK